MTRKQLSAIAIAFTTIFAGQALAADNGPVTRAQVKAELAQAIQNGSMIYDEYGHTYAEFFPHNYTGQHTGYASQSRDWAKAAGQGSTEG